MDEKERREYNEWRAAKKAEALKGHVDKRATELADEIMRPIGIRSNGIGPNTLTTASRADIHDVMRDVIQRGKENELYDRQKGWSKGE